jgi:hypothetical protein
MGVNVGVFSSRLVKASVLGLVLLMRPAQARAAKVCA